MSSEKINELSDDQLLHLYGRIKLNLMLSKLFKDEPPPPVVYALKDQISEQISLRGLDQNGHKHTQ